MALTLDTVIKAVRDVHPAFEERLVPNAVLARFYSQYQRQLVRKLTHVRRDYLASTEDVEFPLATFANGHTLADHEYVIGGTVVFVNTTTYKEELTIVPFGERFQPWGSYPAYIVNRVMYFCGTADDWVPVDKVTVFYVPEIAALTVLTGAGGTFTLPDVAEDALVGAGARFAALRVAGKPDVDIDVAAIAASAQHAEELYLQMVGDQPNAGAQYVTEVW
jgi:hypothetical protein